MKLKNLTPHTVNVNGLSLAPSGIVARVCQSREKVSSISSEGEKIDLYRTTFGQTVDLPDQEPKTLQIVSAMVRIANASRIDLISPGELLRDEAGRVIGCQNFDTNF